MIILNQFGFFTGVSMFDIVATVILAGIIISSIIHLSFWGILFPLAGICIIYADQWNITGFTPWPALLTALLCSIGLSLIFNKPKVWIHHFVNDSSFGSSVINDQDTNVVNCSTSFGNCIKYVNSTNFERANIKCAFGEVKVYFDNAQIPSGNAEIYLDVSFGDVQLFVPDNWKLTNETHVFLGDIKEANRNLGAASPVVTLRGNISFGDTKIVYISARNQQ